MASSDPAQIAVVASLKEAGGWVAGTPVADVLSAEAVMEALPGGQLRFVIIPIESGDLNLLLSQSQSFPNVQFILVKPSGPPSPIQPNVRIMSREDALAELGYPAKTAEPAVRAPTVSARPDCPVPPDSARSRPMQGIPEIPEYDMLQQEPLGHGSAGEVWVARHQKLGKLVALKIVWEQATLLEMHGLRSYYALVSRHPDRFLPIVDPPKSLPGESGGVFYATELADCLLQDRFADASIYNPHTLSKEVRASSHSAEFAVSIITELLNQVRLLHVAGLIHGDIKMGNVVFYQRQPRLMDVTTIGPVMPPGQHREKALGTLGFIPKEGHGQFSGDLYSMGKLLYLLLIRKTDEACPLELKQSDLEALGRHHREPPEFIAALATVVAGACGVTVTTKAGEPKPSPYGRADEMIRDLESAMDLRTQRLRER